MASVRPCSVNTMYEERARFFAHTIFQDAMIAAGDELDLDS